jgi:hypothetical protein
MRPSGKRPHQFGRHPKCGTHLDLDGILIKAKADVLVERGAETAKRIAPGASVVDRT